MPTSDRIEAPSVQGLKRAFDVLNLFAECEQPTLGVTEIAQQLGLSKTVVHRTLTALRASGYLILQPTSHRYSLGSQVLVLGLAYLNRLDIREITREAMVELSARTNETTTLSIRTGWSRVYLDQVTPDRDVAMRVKIGIQYPLHLGASSKALLAYMDQAESEEYLSSHELTALTSRSQTDPVRLRAELQSIREQGFAYSFGERDANAASVASPFFETDGSVRGVISVCGPSERFVEERDSAADLLLETVNNLSRRMGYMTPHPAPVAGAKRGVRTRPQSKPA